MRYEVKWKKIKEEIKAVFILNFFLNYYDKLHQLIL